MIEGYPQRTVKVYMGLDELASCFNEDWLALRDFQRSGKGEVPNLGGTSHYSPRFAKYFVLI